MTRRLALQEEKIRHFCCRHHVRKMSVVGMKNVIVHDDLGVDDQIVWKIATADLPNLIKALEAAQGNH